MTQLTTNEYSIPEYPQLKPIEVYDLPALNKYFSAYRPAICELNPANLIIWQDFDRPKLTRLNGNLCILICTINDDCFFLEPVGNCQIAKTVNTCLDHCGKLSYLSEAFIHRLDISAYKTKCLRNQFDYVYNINKLASLKGRVFDGKRNHIKKFKKHNPNYHFLPFQQNDCHGALALLEKRFGPKNEHSDLQPLAYSSQKIALMRAFEYYGILQLLGAKIAIDDKLIGFIIGSQLNQQTFTAHFQYTDPNYRGAATTLLQEFCGFISDKYQYINLEQDLGIPGLRKSKLSFHPDRLEKKYEITLCRRHA